MTPDTTLSPDNNTTASSSALLPPQATVPVKRNGQRFPIFILLFVLISIFLMGIYILYAHENEVTQKKYLATIQQLKNSKNANSGSLDGQSSFALVPTSTPRPTPRFKFAVDPDKASSSYQVKRTDLTTNATTVIHTIQANPALTNAQNVFNKTSINPFVFSEDQNFLAYDMLELVPSSSNSAAYAVHIFNTDTLKDMVIYRQVIDYFRVFSNITPSQQNIDCSLPQNQDTLDFCFTFVKQLYEKKPILFSADNKKLYLIGYTPDSETTNQGVFALSIDRFQDDIKTVSKSQLSKFPILSPSGKYLLISTISYRLKGTGTLKQSNTTIISTLYDTAADNAVYTKEINAQPDNDSTDQFHVWDPSFITDQQLLISSEKQISIFDWQTTTVHDITSNAIKDLQDKTILFALFHPLKNKIIYFVGKDAYVGDAGRYFIINLDGSGREEIDKAAVKIFYETLI